MLPGVEVVQNPEMPRLSAFEIVTEDGHVLWSKLSQPDGRQNYPTVFPSIKQLIEAFGKYLGYSAEKIQALIEHSAQLDEAKNLQTRMGVW